ncbi:MAG: ABC transporter ATP-binding protein [Planctomycetia bacterium]|nr:ABC transporter ATP-binding protein [Planctomycetia bacterium]
MPHKLLQVSDLKVEFRTDDGVVRAVDGVSFEIEPGQTLGLVGESGSGKSVSNLALLGLVPRPPGYVSGRALFRGADLLTMPQKQITAIRGRRIAMIFQDPMTSLNPFLTVADQLTEVTRRHLGHTPRQALDHAVDMLTRVGIASPERRIFDYPHQFSGGMRQRVMIAMALSCKPDVLIADEPTTALDVTVQAQILDLMRELQRAEGTAIILITHDMGVIAAMCHRVHVMYAGRIVEEAPVGQLFAVPRHPYTLGLLKSIPRVDEPPGTQLNPIAGQPPDLAHLPPGCAFAPRCPYSIARCTQEVPPLFDAPDGGRFACFVDVRTTAPREAVCE